MSKIQKLYTIGPTFDLCRDALAGLGYGRGLSYFETHTVYSKGEYSLSEGEFFELVHRRSTHRNEFVFKYTPGINVKLSPVEFSNGTSDESFRILLRGLGLQAAVLYEKKTELWIKHDNIISLDTTPFGTYVLVRGKEEGTIEFEESCNLLLRLENRQYHEIIKDIYDSKLLEVRFTT